MSKPKTPKKFTHRQLVYTYISHLRDAALNGSSQSLRLRARTILERGVNALYRKA